MVELWEVSEWPGNLLKACFLWGDYLCIRVASCVYEELGPQDLYLWPNLLDLVFDLDLESIIGNRETHCLSTMCMVPKFPSLDGPRRPMYVVACMGSGWIKPVMIAYIIMGSVPGDIGAN